MKLHIKMNNLDRCSSGSTEKKTHVYRKPRKVVPGISILFNDYICFNVTSENLVAHQFSIP